MSGLKRKVQRLPGVRHVRYWLLSFEFNLFWELHGAYYWMPPNQSDLDYLEGVWTGKN